jgi:pyroglutamyl-peptidase
VGRALRDAAPGASGGPAAAGGLPRRRCPRPWRPALADILLTGFQPFAGFAENPSGIAAERLGAELPGRVAAVVLPVCYQAAREGLLRLLAEHRPRACLAMGLAPGTAFRVELVARKSPEYAELPGPARLEGAWPFGRMERILRSAGASVRRSTCAGRYVCNATYWSLLAARAETGWPEHAIFLHVPAISAACPAEETIGIVEAVVRDTLVWLGGARLSRT